MKFTIIIEFIVSGVIILCSILFLIVHFSYDSPQKFLQEAKNTIYDISTYNKIENGADVSKSINIDGRLVGIPIAVILLSLAYCIGIITNMLILLFQRYALTPLVRSSICRKYLEYGELTEQSIMLIFPIKLVKQFKSTILVNKSSRNNHVKYMTANNIKANNKPISKRKLLEIFFGMVRFYVFRNNEPNYEKMYFYNESMQRLSRGLLFALIIIWVTLIKDILFTKWLSVVLQWISCSFFGLYFVGTGLYLYHSINLQNEHALRFFTMSENSKKINAGATATKK